jgi:putative ABC transport system substrate-binding protein
MTGHYKSQSKAGNWRVVLALVIIMGLLLAGCGGAQTPRVYRVGILSGLDFFADTVDGFKAGMTELGYVEGQDIVYDVQKTNFDMAAYKSMLKKFVDDKVDLIFVFPTEASQEAKAATQGTGIPVVFANAFTEDTGLVDSVRQPGGDITGVRWVGPDLALRRFEIMREMVPNAKRMWIPYQRGYPIVNSQLAALRPTAASAGITLLEFPADNAAEVKAELDGRAKSADIGMDAILFLAEPLTTTPDAFEIIGKFAAEHKIPIGGALIQVGEYESIFGLTPQSIPQGKQAAFLADKILRGTPAGSIPVVSAENYLQINYTAAQELGLTVPEGLLSQAAEIIR